MEKTVSLLIIGCFICLLGGCQIGYMGACKKYQKGPDFYKLYDLLQKKSDLADTIMWNNNVFDADGSDQVAEYLKISASIDSIYNVNK